MAASQPAPTHRPRQRGQSGVARTQALTADAAQRAAQGSPEEAALAAAARRCWPSLPAVAIVQSISSGKGDRMTDRYGARQGQIVYGSDGVRLGRVFHCDDFGFVVGKGIVFREDCPVFYDEVLSAEGDEVRLRFPSSALVREEDAEPWDPPRDPVGSAGGVDLEPLRAGMAEIDEVQERLLAIEAGLVEAVARAAQADELGEHALRASAIAELEHRIAEEVEDYERGAACAPRDALSGAAAAVAASRLQRRLAAVARRRAGAIRARAGGAVLRTGRDGVTRPVDRP